MVLLCAAVSFTAATNAQAQTGLALAEPAAVGLSDERLDRISGPISEYVDEDRLPGAVFAVARGCRA